MLALRDLKHCVYDKDGRGAEGMRRLKAVLGQMAGPRAGLQKLLGTGLSVEEIMQA